MGDNLFAGRVCGKSFHDNRWRGVQVSRVIVRTDRMLHLGQDNHQIFGKSFLRPTFSKRRLSVLTATKIKRYQHGGPAVIVYKVNRNSVFNQKA